MSIFFDSLYVVVALFYLPVLFVRGKWPRHLSRRFGKFPDELQGRLAGRHAIWFHAVSVGEVMAVLGLIRAVKDDFPDEPIVLTTVTPTGYQLARGRVGAGVEVIYAPLDFSAVVRRYIRAFRPQMYITAETEIWPNLFCALEREGVDIVVVNGRLSAKSFRRYRRIGFLFKRIIRDVHAFCMQTEADAAKIKSLGAPAERVFVLGNMKFDRPARMATREAPAIGLTGSEKVWIAGSTHPGEEAIVLDAYRRLNADFSDLRLILAPRHVERTQEIAALVQQNGIAPRLFSQKETRAFKSHEVLIVDTIGDLRTLYHLATVVFIGKSLIGQGGQNILEPVFFGKPVIVGPFMQNFRQITELLGQAGGIIQINDARDLLPAVRKLLESPHHAADLGARALRVVHEHQGATEKTRQIISQRLGNSPIEQG